MRFDAYTVYIFASYGIAGIGLFGMLLWAYLSYKKASSLPL